MKGATLVTQHSLGISYMGCIQINLNGLQFEFVEIKFFEVIALYYISVKLCQIHESFGP